MTGSMALNRLFIMDIIEKKEFLDTLIKYRLSFFDFCKDCLGFKDMNSIHKGLCEFLQNDKNKFKLVLMPRYTFKSTLATVGYSLWNMVCNSDTRILIYSDATSKAEAFLSSIKSHIEGKVAKSLFRQYYPHWETDPRAGKWNESQIIISIRKTAFPEPSVDTGGIDTSKVGLHYDIIIFDDIVSDKNITTKDQMDKVTDCYKKALSLLKPNGIVLITGTRWHFGDLYGRIIAENSLKGSFGIFIRKAEENGRYFFDDIGESSLTKDFLDLQRKEQGSYLYSCIYNNCPTDPETAVFKVQDFSFYGNIKPDDLYITITCDPAGEGEDFTGITVVGTDNNMDMHVLEVVNKHLQPSEIVDTIINLQYKYKFPILGIETNFFRGMLEPEIKRRRDEEHKLNPERFKLFGVHEFEASSRKGQGKTNRIMALQPFHERHAIKFPGERFELLTGAFSELAYQMIQFPNSAHDDCVDSLAWHVPLIRKGGLVKKSELPRNSPAWLEKQTFLKEIVIMEKQNKSSVSKQHKESLFKDFRNPVLGY